jgi:hypothetical protein
MNALAADRGLDQLADDASQEHAEAFEEPPPDVRYP